MQEKRKLNLAAWIIIGMLAGIAVGFVFLKVGGTFTTDYLKPVGTIYINDLKKVGSVGIKTFIYYICTTAFAVVVGLVVVNCFKGFFPVLDSSVTSGLEYTATEAPKIMDVIVNIFPDNLFKPMVETNMLPVIVIAIFFGAGILASGEKGRMASNLVDSLEDVVMKVLMMIIKLTPIGVFCLMADVVAVNGAKIVGSLAIVVGVAYIAYILHMVIVYSCSVKFLSGMSPIKFFKGIAAAMLTAFTTTSSNATLPINIECCNDMGAEPEISSFVLPLGATINMDGTAIYQAVAAVFIACCYGVDLTIGQMAMIVVTATLASIGTAGVSGAGMIMLAMVLTAMGIPVDMIMIIYGVDRLFDMGRTALNVTGDISCSICVSQWEAKKAVKK